MCAHGILLYGMRWGVCRLLHGAILVLFIVWYHIAGLYSSVS